ncbi:filaggrin [Pimephales promelas]|uniref:filaggrin n=1 Tax=Pimephales promelas TaxID=90988 RepID=UPI0019557F6D|nr:filaggrin [Pimephales promelas]
MEVLPRRVHHAGSGYLDEKELEKKKQEAHKVFVKEKIKFSAFLNEITRQVLSPSRLTSLGVTDVQRPSSPGQTSTSSKALSPKPEHKSEKKSKISRSRPGSSASSITSTAHSHASKRSHSSKHSHSKRHSHSSKTSRSNKHPYSERDLINQQQHQAVPRRHHDSTRSDTSNTSSSSKCLSSGTERGHKGQKQHRIATKEKHFNRNSHHKSSPTHHHCNEDYHSPPSRACSPESENRHRHSHQESHHHHSHQKSHHRHSHQEPHHRHAHPESHHHHSPSPSHRHGTHHSPSPHHHSPSDSHHHSPSPSQYRHGAHRSSTRSSKSGTHRHRSHSEAHPSHKESHHQHSPSPPHHNQGSHTTPVSEPSHRHSRSKSHHYHSPPPPLHHHGEHGSTSNLSTDSETHYQSDVKLQHHHSDHESSYPKSHHHHHHSRHSHSSNTIQHHHTSDSHSETRQLSHSHNASPTPEHHYHSSHTDSHHSPHQHHHHVSDSYPKGPAHSNSAHHYENHHNTHSESQDPKGHLSRLELHLHSDHDPPETRPNHFPSGSHETPPVEPDHYHHHKSQESHHYSHHHSNPESNHPQHHEHSESHHRSQPESHHHHSQDHHHYPDNPESQNQHSNTEHHHFHSESNHYHSHFKEDHHNDDHTSHLRHSPVGQRSTSPHSNKSNSSASSTIQDDQSTVSYHESSSFLKEKDSELERLTRLQEQNEVLHHNLLQTTVRMECMGSEFKTGHQLIESELQRTRIELNSLLERFTRLQENYSSTQQTNHLLEKKLHCVAQNMDGERERLNQRISELSDQLSTAKTTIQSLETINVTSMLQDALVKHLKSDDPITPLPVAPPPAQFMDSDRYDKVSMHGDDQSLGTLPEEEESDWSEMGEEAQICVLRGSQGNRENASYYQWQQSQGCWEGMNQYSKGNVDTESDSGGEESKCHQPPHGLQIPHLKFTVHPETLPIPVADVSLACFNQGPDDPDCDGYRITDVRNLGSPIRVLSASLEEIHSIGILKQQEQQQDHHKSMMDLHQSQVCTRQVLYEDEIECDWREANSHGAGEHLNGMVGLESAQKMLNHYIHDGESTHL